MARPGFGIREPCASRAGPHTALHPTKPQGGGWGDRRQAVSFSCLSPCDSPATRPCVPCRSPACQHGSHKPGEPVTQRTEEPLVPSAGARQHAQGAARGDQATAAALHRCGGGGPSNLQGPGQGAGVGGSPRANHNLSSRQLHTGCLQSCARGVRRGFHFPPLGG